MSESVFWFSRVLVGVSLCALAAALRRNQPLASLLALIRTNNQCLTPSPAQLSDISVLTPTFVVKESVFVGNSGSPSILRELTLTLSSPFRFWNITWFVKNFSDDAIQRVVCQEAKYCISTITINKDGWGVFVSVVFVCKQVKKKWIKSNLVGGPVNGTRKDFNLRGCWALVKICALLLF